MLSRGWLEFNLCAATSKPEWVEKSRHAVCSRCRVRKWRKLVWKTLLLLLVELTNCRLSNNLKFNGYFNHFVSNVTCERPKPSKSNRWLWKDVFNSTVDFSTKWFRLHLCRLRLFFFDCPSLHRRTVYFDETRNETPRRMFKFNKCSKMSRKMKTKTVCRARFAGLSVSGDFFIFLRARFLQSLFEWSLSSLAKRESTFSHWSENSWRCRQLRKHKTFCKCFSFHLFAVVKFNDFQCVLIKSRCTLVISRWQRRTNFALILRTC